MKILNVSNTDTAQNAIDVPSLFLPSGDDCSYRSYSYRCNGDPVQWR